MSTTATGLVMQDISHAFDRHRVLDGVSITVEKGKVACLLGPSGCGKTTLLRIAAGLEHIQTGRVQIGERLVADNTSNLDLAPEQRNVGLMFQDYALFPHLSVMRNIAFGIAGSATKRQRWIEDALERMGLSGYAERYPHELSGGQQQRVALLRALAPEPGVLLLDEPFSGLDVTRRAQVRDETLALLQETGHTALMVTHDPEEAMFMSDTLLIINEGRLIQCGDPIDIYRHPINAFVAGLFGQINRIEARTGSDGRVQTQLGTFAAPGIAPGEAVDVLVRPEGINAAASNNSEDAIRLQVLSARPIGRSSHLRLVVPTASDEATPIYARIPGVYLPEPGSEVSLSIEPDHVFVFPHTSPSAL